VVDYPADEFLDVDVEVTGQVATVRISPNFRHDQRQAAQAHVHWELGEIFSRLRGDNDVRVVILTGAQDGAFQVPPLTDVLSSGDAERARVDPVWTWKVFTGTVRVLENMVLMEKPIVARVNGDAIGFGQNLMFACDLIYAREDARIADMHMGVGEVEPYGATYSLVPGDGGAVFAPLNMAPALAKEYLMLSKEYRASDLAAMHVINGAVPMAQLDEVVDDAVRRLLKRSSYALAWTKRVSNKAVVAQMNATIDAAAAYEALNFYQLAQMGWKDAERLV
jgi:enoyl-CoA hydratase/carnithine racemase